MTELNLTLDWTPGKGEKGTLTAHIDETPVIVDKGDIRRQKFREDFIKSLVSKYPAIDRQAVRDELIELAAEGDKTKKPTISKVEGELAIIRPERFILPGCNGLLAPVTILEDDMPVGQWRLYIRWFEGKREVQDLEPTLQLPDGQKIYFVPIPLNPTVGKSNGWSKAARKQWLDGKYNPEPVDLFCRVCQKFDEFLDFAEPKAVTSILAAWVFLTYNYQVWDNLPYLNISGPLGSGKSQVLDCLSRLVYRPLMSSSMTGPALFRTLHDRGGTLILDEAERLRQDDQAELRSMLLSGYKKGGCATRLDKNNDAFVLGEHDVYGPKALGGISSLPQTLASRCISIPMFRSGPESDKPRRRLDADPASWQRLRDDLHVMALEHGSIFIDLANDSSACPSDFGGRNYQLWQPILSIGKWIDGLGDEGLVNLLTDYARQNIESAKEHQTSEIDEIVLTTFSEKIVAGCVPTSSDILIECQNREPILFRSRTAKGISAMLKRYGFQTMKSNGRKVYRHVTNDDLRRVQNNYGVDLNL